MSEAPRSMRLEQVRAVAGSALFFVIAPGTVAGLIPWAITGWPMLSVQSWEQVAGCLLAAGGAVFLVECFVRFALQGLGTPAPVAPTKHLVVTGPYRHVRNPMYVAVAAIIFGQALMFASLTLALYGLIAWLTTAVFVMVYEEPTLRRQFGEEYAAYCAHVGPWIPRLTPWRG